MKSVKGRSPFLMFVLSFFLLVSTSGCVYVVVGGLGAFGGYVISPDTVEGILEVDDGTAFSASQEIIGIMGKVIEAREDQGVVVGIVNGAKTTITIRSLKKGTVRLTVKARKAYLPKIAVAQDVFVKVTSYLTK